MIDVRAAFPNAKEKNRRTARGKKPSRYVANAPSLSILMGKIFANVLVSHSECYRGYKRYWYLVHDTANNRYGYTTVHEHERIPFEVNCNSMETLQSVCTNVERSIQWYTTIDELVKMVAQQPNSSGSKAGTNLNFIEMVKLKFPEQFALPSLPPKPVSKYNPFYHSNEQSYRYSWSDSLWNDDYGYDPYYRR